MTGYIQRPDPAVILNELKDFQRQTVDYVFQRLYLDTDRTRRFLVADEVGLGKTLVARGLIARILDHLWESHDRIDIVYICSNTDIARQNVNRLSVPGLSHPAIASRVTLLPITIQNLKHNKVNFISFTPNTTFNLRSREGVWEERAMLYWLLRTLWSFSGMSPYNVLQGDMGTENFRRKVNEFPKHAIDKGITVEFAEAVKNQVQQDILAGRPPIDKRFDALCKRFSRARRHIPPDDLNDRRELVGDLRGLLAKTCLNALKPGLIIMDEFQRFKDLFREESETGELAQKLLDHKGVSTLLLSATPYKMYTTPEELESDDHQKDFRQTLEILFGRDDPRLAQLNAALQAYRRLLVLLTGLGDDNYEALLKAKKDVERLLRKVMVRTERLAATPDRNGMLQSVKGNAIQLAAADMGSYLSLERMSVINGNQPIMEYWKSAPYLLNFMESHYHLKSNLRKAIADGPTSEIHEVLQEMQLRGGLLSWKDVETYKQVDPANARLRQLAADVLDIGAWQLLWLPPTLPYYQMAPPFSLLKTSNLTKRLVFSSWHVVPKVVASLLSYEAERRMVSMLEPHAENSSEARRRRGGLLRISRGEDRLTGMPVLGILYPSQVLADTCDPLQFAVENLTLEGVRARLRELLPDLVAKLTQPSRNEGPVDERWYWAAPIMLDLQHYPESEHDWWNNSTLAAAWTGGNVDPEDEEDPSAWVEHVAEARRLSEGTLDLGPRPDDLFDVLVDIALAGPGVVALRALRRGVGESTALPMVEIKTQAAAIAWAFRSLFNVPEVVSLLRGLHRDISYWRRVLEYSAAGGLQAVMDEYAHLLKEALGLLGPMTSDSIKALAGSMRSALQIRSALLTVDDIRVTPDGVEVGDRRLRTHFAMRFGDRGSDAEQKHMRKEQVREAFNSPFWPFILVSTSVGQEGLDFHLYCHAVVHWNLPSNPVDLEQREGRVHRYKGHAVRKNVVDKCQADLWATKQTDPWGAIFELAHGKKHGNSNDLVPFWIYPDEGEGIAAIERHIPALPLSRESALVYDLSRSLVAYRMAFGQNRQEDLIKYLLQHIPSTELNTLLSAAQIDLSPPAIAARTD